MLIKNREKNKSVALFKCDNCSTKWMGNYYNLIKKNKHFCPSCSRKKGWKENNKNKKTNIPKVLKKYIIKRIDGESLDYLPKNKQIKIIIKCSECGNKRQSNAFDVLNKKSTICIKCCSNKPKNGYDYRRSSKYRKKMSKSMKDSKSYKDSVDLRIEGNKKYWQKLRKGKTIEEIYSEWELYKKKVYRMMEKNYRKYKNIINPDNLSRGKNKYHIDHKFSILEGFKNNIQVEIISHPFNLVMMYYRDNLNKKDKCSITKKELLEGVLIGT
jgi:hypothetical protein